MKRYFLAALCAVLAILGLVNPVLAQVAADNTVDLSPVINHVFAGLGILITGLASALVALAMRWVNAKTGLLNANMQISLQKAFDTKLANAMAAAEAVAKEHIPKDGKMPIDNPFLRAVAKFGLEHYPDTLGKIDLESLASSILARLPTGELTKKAESIRELNAAAPTAPAA